MAALQVVSGTWPLAQSSGDWLSARLARAASVRAPVAGGSVSDGRGAVGGV
jgi:hypothetical protein